MKSTSSTSPIPPRPRTILPVQPSSCVRFSATSQATRPPPNSAAPGRHLDGHHAEREDVSLGADRARATITYEVAVDVDTVGPNAPTGVTMSPCFPAMGVSPSAGASTASRASAPFRCTAISIGASAPAAPRRRASPPLPTVVPDDALYAQYGCRRGDHVGTPSPSPIRSVTSAASLPSPAATRTHRRPGR